ncbi:MAG: sorbosone dehydrogenase [Bacteroidales bacterium]|nr:sorbosone dehydrogenase [Bacteroidales bacterium]
MAVNNNGDMYVILANKKNNHGMVALRDTNLDFRADIIEYFGDVTGSEIRIYKGYLYVGSKTEIWRYRLVHNQLLPDTAPELVIGGFEEQNQHAYKTFAFDSAGYVYVNVGAPSNACMEQTRTKGSPGLDPCPQLKWQAGIWRFSADKLGQTHQKNGFRYATGIRNAVAIEWNYLVDKLFVVQHGRDQLYELYPELYKPEEGQELPGEEFFMVEEGDDFGWPYCYFDGIKNKRMLAPEYGGDNDKTGRCRRHKRTHYGFPAHCAPNDLKFYTHNMFPEKYRNGAFVAFHGSWNRAPGEQKGYNVIFVPFNKGLPESGWEIFADGFKGNEPVYSPSDARYRPNGLAQGPKGELYVTETRQGRIWAINYTVD